MSHEKNFERAIIRLNSILATKGTDEELRNLIDSKNEVVARFRAVFSDANIDSLAEEDVREFLQFRHNKHWWGLQRMAPLICDDMKKLRKGLKTLLDEKQPIRERLNSLVRNKGQNYVRGLGRAVITPILMTVFPEKYSVWNNISEGALRAMEIWPNIDRNNDFGERYEAVNNIQLRLASALLIDTWTLDALMWRVQRTVSNDKTSADMSTFYLEKHLQEFLRDNWQSISFCKDWNIYESDGDIYAGYEYICEIGRIDILAKHKNENKWLVIELKKDQSHDATVGQVLRYIGWVRQNLAEKKDDVLGVIISRKSDEGLKYAISEVPFVSHLLYEIDFQLKPLHKAQDKKSERKLSKN